MVGVANLALVLPDVQLGVGSPLMWVLNDGPNACVVFPAIAATGNPAHQLNGVNNASLSIPSGQAAVFSLFDARRTGRGGGVQPVAVIPGWRGAVLP